MTLIFYLFIFWYFVKACQVKLSHPGHHSQIKASQKNL